MDQSSQRTAGAGWAFCSLVEKRQVGQARALAASLRNTHPRAPVFVLLLDPPEGRFRPESEPFTVVGPDELAVEGIERLRFLHTAAGLRCLLKPHLLGHVVQSSGARRVAYFDPDVVVEQPLRHVEQLQRRYPVVVGQYLPPAPYDSDAIGSAAGIPAGLDNPTFITLASGPTTEAYLTWWKQRLGGGKRKAVDDDPFARHRWVDCTQGVYRRCGLPRPTDWPYTWSQFDNGVPIPELIRNYYRTLGPQEAAYFGNPFVTAAPTSFFAWLTSFDGPKVPPLCQIIHDLRADLRQHFPDMNGRDRAAFLEWVVTHGVQNHRLDPRLLWALLPGGSRPTRPVAGPASTPVARYRPATEAFGVNVLGFLQSEKGVGEASRTTIRAIAAADIPHALNNWVDGGSSNTDTTLTGFTTENPYPVNIIHLNADATPWLLEEMPWYFRGRYNIGFWNWELEWFPERWHATFETYDEVWAPSTFTQESIARVAPFPVFRVPYSVTVPPARPELLRRERYGLPRDRFVFLFAFDFHSYFARKNPVAVIEAFRKAFGRRRDVHLVLKSSRSDAAPREFAEVLAACGGQPNIQLLRDVLSRDEMYALLRLCDGYVALHRSEGFGLPLAEAMALGKPVIATDYSANVDFMNESNSFPVRYRMTVIDEDHGPYRRGKLWADPDVGHAAEQMLRVVDDPVWTARVANRAREDTEWNLSPKAVGRIIRGRLATILGVSQDADATPSRAA